MAGVVLKMFECGHSHQRKSHITRGNFFLDFPNFDFLNLRQFRNQLLNYDNVSVISIGKSIFFLICEIGLIFWLDTHPSPL